MTIVSLFTGHFTGTLFKCLLIVKNVEKFLNQIIRHLNKKNPCSMDTNEFKCEKCDKEPGKCRHGKNKNLKFILVEKVPGKIYAKNGTFFVLIYIAPFGAHNFFDS